MFRLLDLLNNPKQMALINLKYLSDQHSALFALPGDHQALSRQLLDQGAYVSQGEFLTSSEGQQAADLIWKIFNRPDLDSQRQQLFPQARPPRPGDIVQVDQTVWLRTGPGWLWYNL
jgi:hypothetical protein